METLAITSTSTSVAGIDGFQAYLREVNNFPILSHAEEKQLFQRFHEHEDLDAARQLVTSHLRYVAYIAKSYAGYGLATEDLMQQGSIGLMKSVKRFDPAHGVRLVTFAVHWIKAEINDFVLRNWKIVKVATTKAQRKLFFNLRKSKKALGWLNREEASRIAKDLNVETKDVVEMESRLFQQDSFFDPSYGDDLGDEYDFSAAKASCLEDNSFQPEEFAENQQSTQINQATLHKAVQALDERSRDILESRWLQDNKVGLKSLSERYGISMERIRQIETAAIKKIRHQFTDAGYPMPLS